MSNPYYNSTFSASPFTLIRSATVNAQFQLIGAGFDAFYTAFGTTNSEVIAARESQASLLFNIQRRIRADVGLTQNLAGGGYRITGLGAGVDGGDAVNMAQLIAASFGGAIPGLTGKKRKPLRANTAETGIEFADEDVTLVNGATTLEVCKWYRVDSSGGPFSLTLPSMSDNDWIGFFDGAGSLATNNVTILHGSLNIRGAAEDLILDVNWDSLRLVKTSAGLFER